MSASTSQNAATAFEQVGRSARRAVRGVGDTARHAAQDSATVLEREWADLKGDLNDLISNPALRDMPEVRAFRERLQDTLHRAGEAVADASYSVSRRVRDTAHAADDYVHESPWKMMGVAALAGLALGVLALRR